MYLQSSYTYIILDPLDPLTRPPANRTEIAGGASRVQRELRRVRVLKQTLRRARPYANHWRVAAQGRAVRAAQAQVRHFVAFLEGR